MKYINRIVLVLVLVFCSSLYGQSQLDKVKRIPAEDMALKRTELLAKDLKLSKTQKEAVYEVHLEAAKKRKKVFENASIFSLRKQLKPIKREVDTTLSTILTESQQQLYLDEAYQETLKERMKIWINDF